MCEAIAWFIALVNALTGIYWWKQARDWKRLYEQETEESKQLLRRLSWGKW